MTRVSSLVRILAVALGLGEISNVLFYGNSLGISVPLFALGLIVALFALGRLERVRFMRANLWLVRPLLVFAGLACVRANTVLTIINVALVFSLLCLLFFFYAADRVEQLGLAGYPAVLLLTVKHLLGDAAPVVGTVGQAVATRHGGRVRAGLPVARGLLLAVPVVLVFTGLLSSADLIFAHYVEDVLQLRFLRDLPELLWRLELVLAVAWVVAGGLIYALRRGQPDPLRAAHLPGSRLPDLSIGFAEGAVVLTLVNALFLIFAWIQWTYLFSGQAARTMNYADYREYVRRGFGELLVVAVLTLVLILGVHWLAWRETVRETRILNGLSTLMIALALVLLGSAFTRMVVWEGIEYYINTPLRLYVRWFIVWLALLFGWLGLTLWLRPRRFAIGAFVALLGFAASINMINPDADVAAYNLGRQDELSTRYLDLLSEDAVPVLVGGLDWTSGEVQQQLRIHLAQRLATMELDQHWQSWPAFHWARWEAYTQLTEARAAGKLETGDLPPH